jgi:hypothetical protein
MDLCGIESAESQTTVKLLKWLLNRFSAIGRVFASVRFVTTIFDVTCLMGMFLGNVKSNGRPPISAARWSQMVFAQSFNKVLSIMSDKPFESLNPVFAHALKLLKSDTVKQASQNLAEGISISRSSILQCCLGPSQESEVAQAHISRITWMDQSFDLHSANCLQCFRSLSTRQLVI